MSENATLTICIDISKTDKTTDQTFSQAILDYLTNHPKIAHILYFNNTFLLNQTDPVEIEPDIFVKSSTHLKLPPPDQQWIEFYSMHKTTTELRAFLNAIQEKYIQESKNKFGKNRYFFQLIPQTATTNMDGLKEYISMPPAFRFTMKPFTTNRRFANLFGENIDKIRQRVDFFRGNKAWYNEKGIPYTLGVLLSGPPGTGKTSTIKCLANECQRHIINVHLNNDITKIQMENLFFQENMTVFDSMTNRTETVRIPLDQRLYVFEDIDCQSDLTHARDYKKVDTKVDSLLDRQKLNESLKMDLSFLLNLLDGVMENPGRIVVMTSNHVHVLDPALIRPGRIDIVAELGRCSTKTLADMLGFFFSEDLATKDSIQDSSNDSSKDLFQGFDGVFTPAEVSKICFENHGDYRAAVSTLCSKGQSTLFQEKLDDDDDSSDIDLKFLKEIV